MTIFTSFSSAFVAIGRWISMVVHGLNFFRRIALGLCSATILASGAQAALVQGDFVLEQAAGSLPSVATVEALINSQLGTSLSLLQLTDPITNGNGSETSSFGTFTSSDSIIGFAGSWTFSPLVPGHNVDFILATTDHSFAIWDFRTVAMANIGCWNTIFKDASCVTGLGGAVLGFADDNFEGLVALTAAVPIPAAGWLFISALVGLWIVRRRNLVAATDA